MLIDVPIYQITLTKHNLFFLKTYAFLFIFKKKQFFGDTSFNIFCGVNIFIGFSKTQSILNQRIKLFKKLLKNQKKNGT